MEDLKTMARAAKQRLKSDFWEDYKRELDAEAYLARENGLSAEKVKTSLRGRLRREINGNKQDDFYLRVKKLLDAEGEVSDAIGRLTDKKYFETLSYEEKQRYTLELSSKYRLALERYRKEKELGY